jgi:hypothetical protein
MRSHRLHGTGAIVPLDKTQTVIKADYGERQPELGRSLTLFLWTFYLKSLIINVIYRIGLKTKLFSQTG